MTGRGHCRPADQHQRHDMLVCRGFGRAGGGHHRRRLCADRRRGRRRTGPGSSGLRGAAAVGGGYRNGPAGRLDDGGRAPPVPLPRGRHGCWSGERNAARGACPRVPVGRRFAADPKDRPSNHRRSVRRSFSERTWMRAVAMADARPPRRRLRPAETGPLTIWIPLSSARSRSLASTWLCVPLPLPCTPLITYLACHHPGIRVGVSVPGGDPAVSPGAPGSRCGGRSGQASWPSRARGPDHRAGGRSR